MNLELGIAELAERVGISRPTAHRYAITLVELGFLEQGTKRKYRLSGRAADPGRVAIEALRDRVRRGGGLLFWRRPERLLDSEVGSAQSVWALLDPGVEQRIVERLSAALESGVWDAEHGHLRARERFDGVSAPCDLRGSLTVDGALRLVISEAP